MSRYVSSEPFPRGGGGTGGGGGGLPTAAEDGGWGGGGGGGGGGGNLPTTVGRSRLNGVGCGCAGVISCGTSIVILSPLICGRSLSCDRVKPESCAACRSATAVAYQLIV